MRGREGGISGFAGTAIVEAFLPHMTPFFIHRHLRTAVQALSALLLVHTANAALIITYAEDSNSYVSTLSNTTVFNFNSITANTKATNLAWSNGTATIGTIDRIFVKAPDQYGGAGPAGSNYAVDSLTVGGSNATPTTTITFTAPHAYFGLWWSAGDALNVLTFYSEGLLVAEFTTSSLLNKLASAPEYKGNPRTNENPGQAYAFINFFGMQGTTWDQVVFSNQGTSGFESDNWTDRATAWGTQPGETGRPPGVEVVTLTDSKLASIPEPSAALCLLAGLSLLAIRRRG